MKQRCDLSRQFSYTHFHWNRTIILIVVADLPSKVFCRLWHNVNEILSNLIVYSLKCTTNRHRFNTDENTGTCPLSDESHCFERTECWVHLSAQDLLCTECWVHSRPRTERSSVKYNRALCVGLIRNSQISGTSSSGVKKGRRGTYKHTQSEGPFRSQTGSRLTYAENEGVERSKERRNGWRVIGGRGKMERSVVGGKGVRMMWGRGTRHEGAGRRVPGLGQITWWIMLTKKIEGPCGEIFCTEFVKYLMSERSRLWVHRDSWLRAQMCAVLELNTIAQRLSLLSHLLRSPWYPLGPNCWRFPHSFW